MDMIRLGRGLARFIEALARFIPSPDVHHRHAALVMLFGAARILFLRRLHALVDNFQVHTRAVGKFLAGPLQHVFEYLLGAREFLLMEQSQSFIVSFELLLHPRIDQFHAAALGRGWRS